MNESYQFKNRSFITIFTKASHFILHWTRLIRSTSSGFVPLRPICIIFMAFAAQSLAMAPSFLRFFEITHYTPQSVGLLRTSDQPVAETSTWQHTTLTTDKHPCPCGIRTRNLSRRAAADLGLRPRGHWYRPIFILPFHLFQSFRSGFFPVGFLAQSSVCISYYSHIHNARGFIILIKFMWK